MKKRKYGIMLTVHEKGYVEVCADSEKEAHAKAAEAVANGNVTRLNARITNAAAKMLNAPSERIREIRKER